MRDPYSPEENLDSINQPINCYGLSFACGSSSSTPTHHAKVSGDHRGAAKRLLDRE